MQQAIGRRSQNIFCSFYFFFNAMTISSFCNFIFGEFYAENQEDDALHGLPPISSSTLLSASL